jgi:hypothetical protein
MVGAMQEALGETSAATSQLVSGEGDRTATEIRETSLQRNARDNFNQMFLSESVRDQMTFWHLMNRQFMFDKENEHRVFRIVGSDALRFFEEAGMASEGLSQDAIDQITSPEMEEVIADPSFDLNSLVQPLFPVSTPGGEIPKFILDEGGKSGQLIVQPEDISGNYDYVPDVKSMSVPDPTQVQALTQMLGEAKDPAAVQLRAQQGETIKIAELEKDLFSLLGIKDSAKYYERIQEGGIDEQAQQTGAGGAPGGPTGQPNGGVGGVSQGVPPVAGV